LLTETGGWRLTTPVVAVDEAERPAEPPHCSEGL